MLKTKKPKTMFGVLCTRIWNSLRVSDFGFRISDFQRGFGVVEIVVVVGVLSMVLFAFLQAEILAVRLLRTEKLNLEAGLFATEGMEAVRSIRDGSWSSNIAPLINGTTYYPIVENGKWKLTTTAPAPTNGFSRAVVFAAVNRDAQDNIAIAGTLDTDTRKVTVTATSSGVSYQLTGYITNFQNSLSLPTEVNAISYEGANTDADVVSFPSNNTGGGDPAQAFTTLSSALQVTKVELYIKRASTTPSNIYVELRTAPNSTVMGTSNIVNASTIINTAPAWVEFRFPDPVSLSATTKYYVRLRSIPNSTDTGSGSAGAINWDYGLQNPSGPYAGGEARRYIGAHSNQADDGQSLDQYDFGFRVYAQ